MRPWPFRVVGVAASTGGPDALKRALGPLGPDLPACVAVVQHIAPGFAQPLADSLAAACVLKVAVCRQDQPLERGVILVAPSRFHLAVRLKDGVPWAVQEFEPSGQVHRPSADVLFSSMAESCGRMGVGVVLTGMGHDGAEGLARMRLAGAVTIAQDDASAHGMPRAARQAGAVMEVASLDEIAARITEAVGRPI